MKLEVHSDFNIAPQLEAGDVQPSVSLPFGNEGGVWHILQKPIATRRHYSRDETWSHDRGSAHFRLPLIKYRLNGDSPGLLLKFGAQLAALATLDYLPAGKLGHLVIIFSTIYARDDGRPGAQVWAGVAVHERSQGV